MNRWWLALAFVSLGLVLRAQEQEPTAQEAQQQLQQELGISADEAKELDGFLENFYQEDLSVHQMTQQMNAQSPKYYAKGKQAGTQVKPTDRLQNNQLVLSEKQQAQLSQQEKQHPLLKSAQAKGTDKFYRWYCEHVLGKRKIGKKQQTYEPFKGINCEEIVKADRATLQQQGQPTFRATAEANDDVADLTATWMDSSEVDRTMDFIESKKKGETKLPLWSDDYWSISGGITSSRYAEGFETNTNEANWRKNVGSYAQPGTETGQKASKRLEWTALWDEFGNARGISRLIQPWSPAEKLDVSSGDTDFTLTNEQKGEGGPLEKNGEVETWMGICHGWAAASIMTPPAETRVTLEGAKGVDVRWNPHDISAMQQLAWANGATVEYSNGRWVRSESNYVGGRCNVKDARTNKAGRLVNQECFDNNPATFLLALSNMIGKKGLSFVMDKTFDYEVWNQPVHSYSITFFNPLKKRKRCSKWEDCAVDYNRQFKRKDRFKATRGKRNPRNGRYDDSSIEKVVGFVVSVQYVSESWPTVDGKPSDAILVRVNYTGDLEIEKGSTLPGGGPIEAQNRGKWIAAGGEWHKNAHPDFLWIPRRNSVPVGTADANAQELSYEGKATADLAEAAREGSAEGMPLCKVVQYLTNNSLDKRHKHAITPRYVCPFDEDIPAEWQ
ncbi:MAG: hypothetical protein H6617_09575 [Bdellovibrionaceae bacterium]|nr:hypothetical protein [Pseudobdellovibrionaceae bacterium]